MTDVATRQRGHRVLSAIEVESEIARLSDELEAGMIELVDYAQGAANAEHAYKVRYAQELLKAANAPGSGRTGKTTADEKEAMATVATAGLLRDRLISEAHHETCKEKLRTLRAQLSALQTIASNLRAQT